MMKENPTTAEKSGGINMSTLTDEYNFYASNMVDCINQINTCQDMLNDMVKLFIIHEPITIDEINSIPDTSSDFKHIHQKRFKGCKNIFPLPFDFYLPEHKICIEFDGIQHYEPVERFGGVEGLKTTQKNDVIKTQYCLDNGIKLIRIRYDENVGERLKGIFE